MYCSSLLYVEMQFTVMIKFITVLLINFNSMDYQLLEVKQAKNKRFQMPLAYWVFHQEVP